MSLKEVFCQDRAISTLQRAYGMGRMAHAYIFVGPDGVGKFKLAREWAKMLLCHGRVEEKTSDGVFNDSCGKCESCLVFEGDGHADFISIYKELIKFTKDGKNKNTPVDMPINVIREFLIEKVASRPTMGKKTVYVISESEKLNNASQNAILKVLEEPPAYCSIILLCTRLDRLLPTTQSRCQVVRFGDIDEQRIIEKLIENGTGGDEARYWARFAQGSIGTAIAWAGLELAESSCYEIKCRLVKGLAAHRLGNSVDFAEWMSDSAKKISAAWSAKEKSTSKTDITRRAQKGLLQMVVAAFRDVMRLEAGVGENLVNSDQMEQIEALAGRYGGEVAAEMVAKAYENILWVEKSVNEKLIFEELLLNYSGSGRI